MNDDRRLYYYSCLLLEWSLTAFAGYIMDEINSAALQERFDDGNAQLEHLAEWVMEQFSLSSSGGTYADAEEAKQLFFRFESYEPTVLAWLHQLWARANVVSAQIQGFDTEEAVYYYTCAWAERVLDEFRNLMAQVTTVELGQRYQSGQPQLASFDEWLQTELAYLNEQAAKNDAKLLRKDVIRTSEALSRQWVRTVLVAARE